MNEENLKEYEGVYVAHWEVSRFVVEGKKILGIFPKVEKWWPHFPEGFCFPGNETRNKKETKIFKIKVLAKVGPKGNFGHKGVCKREIFIKDVLVLKETDQHGKLW